MGRRNYQTFIYCIKDILLFPKCPSGGHSHSLIEIIEKIIKNAKQDQEQDEEPKKEQKKEQKKEPKKKIIKPNIKINPEEVSKTVVFQ